MRIEYEDKDILVIYKEAGLPVQTGRTSGKDVVSILKNHLAQEMQLSAAKPGGAGPNEAQLRMRKLPGPRPNGAGPNEAQLRRGKMPVTKPGGTGPNEAQLRRGKVPVTKPGGAGQPGTEPYLGIIHRLDQPVEGLLVFAKTPKSAAVLSSQAAAKEDMEKVYQALVRLDPVSYPQAIEGMKKEVTLVDWIGRDFSSNLSYIGAEGEKGLKRAELVFRTLKIKDSAALLEISLHTGRHHQIRIQMSHAHMPLLGDRKYGAGEVSSYVDIAAGYRGLCLCASRLSFVHPATKKRMEFSVAPSFLG